MNSDLRLPDLPRNWVWVSFANLVNGSQNGLSKRRGESGIPTNVLRLADITEGRISSDSPRSIMLTDSERDKYLLQKGDLICIRVNGSRALTGTIIPVESTEDWGFCDHFIRFKPNHELVDYRYLDACFDLRSTRERVEQLLVTTAGQNTINQASIIGLLVPLAPRNEQRRIASKIDELFSRIDEGERALTRVRKLVERYRQSVLKAAVTGELTRDWREARRGQLESGQTLLARILKARREAWEKAELEKMIAKGKPPANDKWKQKYKEPASIETDFLDVLPDGWGRVRADVAGEVQLGRQRSPAHHSGEHMRPYLRVANVFEEKIDSSDVMEMNFTPEEFVTYELKPGDILLNEGQSKELVGRPAIYNDEISGSCFTNTLVRFRCTTATLPEFALIVFLHYMKSGQFRKIAKITTNIAHLGASRFAEMSFPVPCLEEQQEIVARVNQQKAAIEHFQNDVVGRARQVSALRQSVLKSAFSGQLVPQDPTDEPASALLERIAAERAAQPTAARRGRKRRF